MRRFLKVLVVLVVAVVAFNYLAPRPAARIALALERLRCGLSAGKTAIPGFEIAYLEGGEGEPLLLIHGFGADKDNFTRVSAYLTGHYRVIIPDLPGFGESSRPEGVSYEIEDQVERVRAFAGQLGITRMHLGGSSMGGFISAAYAAKYPDEVASLWLLAPGGARPGFDSKMRRAIEETGRNPLLSKTPEDFSKTIEVAMSRQPWVPYSVKRALAERAAADYELHGRIYKEIREPTLDSFATRLDTPALIVWGKEDRVLNPEDADALRAIMPNAQVVLMDGIGHLPMLEAPKQTAEDYLRFRGELDAGKP
jgi:pimeloyl-ACP methyl ester carboxylesterase